MARLPDTITFEALPAWDELLGKEPEAVCELLYQRAATRYVQASSWYWGRVRRHRRQSFVARWATYVLALVGAALNLAASAMSAPEARMQLVVAGVVAVSLAGLVNVGDRTFGWSNGWLRYVRAATAIETRTQAFVAAWGERFVGTRAASPEDARAAHKLVAKYLDELARVQDLETEHWVTEFNAGLQALSSVVTRKAEEPGA